MGTNSRQGTQSIMTGRSRILAAALFAEKGLPRLSGIERERIMQSTNRPEWANELLMACAALAAGISKRDQQIGSLSEQIRLFSEESSSKANAAAARTENLQGRFNDLAQDEMHFRGVILDQFQAIATQIKDFDSAMRHDLQTLMNHSFGVLKADVGRVETQTKGMHELLAAKDYYDRQKFTAIQQQIKETQALIAVTAETRRRAKSRKRSKR